MQALPPKLAAALAPFGRDLAEEAARSTGRKQRGTDESRADHFLKWFHTLTDDSADYDPRMASAPVQARNYVLACYTVALIRGDTLKGIRIKLGTVRGYIKAATKIMSAGWSLGCDMNPRNSPVDYVDILFKAIDKYEKVPKRSAMIYDDMFYDMLAETRGTHPDGREAAIMDWLILGRYTGARASEYCQSTLSKFAEIDLPRWEGPRAYAFIAQDFTFFDDGYRPLPAITADMDSTSVRYVRIRWRWQKNGDHGESIPYERDDVLSDFCPVRAALRIYQRALRLGVPPLHPIGVFRASKRAPRGRRYQFVRSAEDIQDFVRASAARVFGFRPGSADVESWTSHSPRVTACNLLHRQHASDSYIKQRLRWRSDTFMVYLRNTVYSASRHRQTLHISANNLPTLYDGAGAEVPRIRPADEEDEITQVLRMGSTLSAA